MNIFQQMEKMRVDGRAFVLCTVVRTHGSVPRHVGAKMVVLSDGSIQGTVGGGQMESRVITAALKALKDRKASVVRHKLQTPENGDPGVCGGELEVFMEPIYPNPKMMVIGGGHVGCALVHLAKWLGFHVTLSDDRPEFCTPGEAPEADEYLCVPIGDLPQKYPFDNQTYVVLVTRGAPLDVDGLPALLRVPHAYLGVIGSRRRWATVVKKLLDRGVKSETLKAIHAPVGLELNAETPREIALSILAEVLLHHRGGSGGSMRWSPDGED